MTGGAHSVMIWRTVQGAQMRATKNRLLGILAGASVVAQSTMTDPTRLHPVEFVMACVVTGMVMAFIPFLVLLWTTRKRPAEWQDLALPAVLLALILGCQAYGNYLTEQEWRALTEQAG